MPKTIFTLIRHAESEANADVKKENKIGGHNLEVELTQKGQAQAEALGEYFKSEGVEVTKIYSSTARRTLHTAALCLQRMGITTPVQATEELLEQSHGGWMGQSRDIYKRQDVREALDKDNWNYIPGDDSPGESQKMVAERMLGWINKMLKDLQASSDNQHIFVFTHGLAIKFLLAELLNLERSTAYTDKVNPIDNASITQLCYEEGQLQPIAIRNFRPF